MQLFELTPILIVAQCLPIYIMIVHLSQKVMHCLFLAFRKKPLQKKELSSMNGTVEEVFLTSCHMFGVKHVYVAKLPSKNLFINQILAIAFNGILIFPTLSLNAVAVITIIKTAPLRSKPSYFIVSLQSMFDLAVGLLGIPLFIFFLGSAIGGISNCNALTLVNRLMFVPIEVSTVLATAMTVERYIAILHPYAYKVQVTKRKILLSVGFSSVLSIFLTNLVLTVQNLIRIYMIVKVAFVLFLTAYAYTRIYLVVRNLARSQMKLPHGVVENMNVTKMKKFFQEVKQAKSCFVVVVCFFVLSFLPPAIAVPIASGTNEFEELRILIWAFSINVLNSTANSAIFFWTKTMLRKEALKLLNFR